MRFVPIDDDERLFVMERYCFMGAIDDWIEIGAIDKLDILIKRYVEHPGTPSFYELL